MISKEHSQILIQLIKTKGVCWLINSCEDCPKMLNAICSTYYDSTILYERRLMYIFDIIKQEKLQSLIFEELL